MCRRRGRTRTPISCRLCRSCATYRCGWRRLLPCRRARMDWPSPWMLGRCTRRSGTRCGRRPIAPTTAAPTRRARARPPRLSPDPRSARPRDPLARGPGERLGEAVVAPEHLAVLGEEGRCAEDAARARLFGEGLEARL